MPVRAERKDGTPAHPGLGITPIFKQLEPGVLQVVGTGFYVTRYGLIVTAKHVVDAITAPDGVSLLPSAAWHLPDDARLMFRPIISASVDKFAPTRRPDIAVLQADTGQKQHGKATIVSDVVPLRMSIPAVGSHIATYAYPGNARLDFRKRDAEPPRLNSDSFDGQVVGQVTDGPLLRYAHVRTTMPIPHGASGGPVFGPDGRAFAVNCVGWDLDEREHGTRTESAVVPLGHLLDLDIAWPLLPDPSYELDAVPAHRRGQLLKGRELFAFRHIFDVAA